MVQNLKVSCLNNALREVDDGGKIKVVHFIHGLSMGGAEQIVKTYAMLINREKFNVTVLCFYNYHSSYDQQLRKNGIHVVYLCDYLPTTGRQSVFTRFYNRIQRIHRTNKAIHSLKPDILHYHLTLSGYVKKAKLSRDTILVYTQHFDVDRWKRENPTDYHDFLWLAKHYNLMAIAINSYMKVQLGGAIGKNHVLQLNNGIDFARYGQTSKIKARKKYNIPDDAFVVGHIGRYSKVKNHTFLVDVFEKIKERHPNAWLLMAGGTGDIEDELKKELKNRNLWQCTTMLFNRTDVPDILSCMDVFVFPSFSEGLPISTIEAQASGVPCIVSTAVPENVIISNLVCRLSLQDGIETWVEKSLTFHPDNVQYSETIDEWDIHSVVKKLEAMYLQLVQTDKGNS